MTTDYTVHDLVQGSPEWQAFRLNYHGASEAAAMLGLSSNMKRTELLHIKYTGTPKEFSDFVQERILDRGHEVEALARPLVEEDLGEELYPVTCSLGKESASCDGLTMGGDVAFEHKQWNEELAAQVRDGIVPDSHMPQCQQILMVTGARRVRFVVSDGTRDRFVWVDVKPDQTWFKRIAAGWAQFDKDVEAYEPQEVEVKPVGRTPETLPALRIEVRGQVTASNLQAFREHAVEVFGGINRDLQTDQDFADAEKIVKWCGDVEARLDAAKQHVQSQMESVDEVFRTVDDIKEIARRTRLDLAKLVDQRKVEIKEGIIKGGRVAFTQHVQALKEETGGVWVDLGMPDFAGAAKGKRSVSSIRDAVDTMLANAKIDADALAKRLRENIAYFDGAIKGFEFLFADRMGLCTKQLDDIKMVVSNRIEKHKLDKQREEEETRARIQREEQAKAEREQREAKEVEDSLITGIWKNARRIEADRVPYIEKAIRTFESMAGDWENDPRPRVAEAIAAAREEMQEKLRAAQERERQAESPAPAPAPAAAPAPAPRPAAPVARVARVSQPAKATRPTDAEIIAALISYFEATEGEVIGWLCELDFSSTGHAA